MPTANLHPRIHTLRLGPLQISWVFAPGRTLHAFLGKPVVPIPLRTITAEEFTAIVLSNRKPKA